jgi:hypothetical protein
VGSEEVEFSKGGGAAPEGGEEDKPEGGCRSEVVGEPEGGDGPGREGAPEEGFFNHTRSNVLAARVVLHSVRSNVHVVLVHLVVVHLQQSRHANCCMLAEGAVLLAGVCWSEAIGVKDRSHVLVMTSGAVGGQQEKGDVWSDLKATLGIGASDRSVVVTDQKDSVCRNLVDAADFLEEKRDGVELEVRSLRKLRPAAVYTRRKVLCYRNSALYLQSTPARCARRLCCGLRA